jgi:hypothetical protein
MGHGTKILRAHSEQNGREVVDHDDDAYYSLSPTDYSLLTELPP